MLFIVVFLAFLSVFSYAEQSDSGHENFEYEKLEITNDEIAVENADFAYDFLKGRVKQLRMHDKAVLWEHANLSFEDVANYWNIYAKSGCVSKSAKSARGITMFSSSQGVVQADEISLQQQILTITDFSLTPCQSPACWKINCAIITSDKEKIVAKKNSVALGVLSLPWLDLAMKHKPSSGFLVSTLKKDEFDGFVLSMPYYVYLHQDVDCIFEPKVGENIGINFSFRRRFENILMHANSDMKYWAKNNLRRGGYLNVRSELIGEYEQLDYNLLFVTSKEYAKYWDNKENMLRRSFIPSYFNYMPNKSERISFTKFFAANNGDMDLFIPKFTSKRMARSPHGNIRMESSNEMMIYSDKDEFIVQENINYSNNFLVSFASNPYGSRLISMSTEGGLKYINQADRKIARLFLLHEIALPAIGNQDIQFLPYMKGKFVHEVITLKKRRKGKWMKDPMRDIYSISHTFYEPIENKDASSAFNIGTTVPLRDVLLDVGYLQDKKDKYKVIGLQYSYQDFFVMCKDYWGQNHNLNASIGFVHNGMTLSSDYTAFEYENVMHHKIFGKMMIDLTHGISIGLNGLYRIKPVNELIQGGVQCVLKTKCWRFSCGVSYGSNALDYLDKQQKTIFTFSVSIAGYEQFKHAADKLKTLKHDAFTLAENL